MEEADNSESNKQDKIITLRSYQTTIVEHCLKGNSIVYLPTGSGKTIVAIEVLRHMGSQLNKKPRDGGKRSVFLLPTKALVIQQASVLRQQLPYKVGFYLGDMGVDFWPKQKWEAEFNMCQVMAMTPKILENILGHGYITLDIFNLIVFDECHHAVQDHSYRNIMKNMEHVDKKDQPRIIGLSATLLNRTVNECSVEKELTQLEESLHGKIVTLSELTEVIGFCAAPICEIAEYDEFYETASVDITKILANLDLYRDIEKSVQNDLTPIGFDWTSSKNALSSKLRRLISDFEMAYKELGVYGGATAALFHTLNLNRKRMLANNEMEELFISVAITELELARGILLRTMSDDESGNNILKFSSSKIVTLMDVLRKHGDKDISTILFVQRRSTAVILNHILRQLTNLPIYSFIKPGFIIGDRSIPFQFTGESILETKWRQNTIKKFANKEINVLIATSIMEEGIDISQCNLVICFDSNDLHYRSFVQGKGRARDKDSKYICLSSKGSNSKKCQSKFVKFVEIEETLKMNLSKKSDFNDTAASPGKLYNNEVEPFYVSGPGGAFVTGITAIDCVNSYCSRLPHDLFSILTPIIHYKYSGSFVIASVQLPVASKVKQTISGLPMKNRKLAKRSAFVNVIRELYRGGELTDELKMKDAGIVDRPDTKLLFKLYKEGERFKLDGLKTHKHQYRLTSPSVFEHCLPEINIPCYVHVLNFTPNFEEPTLNRRKVFYQMLKNTNTFAILSTKPLPKVCSFSLYMNVGEVICTVIDSGKMVSLSETQLDDIIKFHYQLFTQVVPCGKEFQILSKSNEYNAFYIVPVEFSETSGIFTLNWNVITHVEELLERVPENASTLVVNNDTHNLAVISPFYRGTARPQYYVVTRVCNDLSPLSDFPTNNNSRAPRTYFEYFEEKYNALIENKNQPLLEVKSMPHLRTNFIRPRVPSQTGGIKSRRKMQEQEDDFDEVLVPELCDRYLFPSVLWLKAFLLPTALHRLSHAYFVEEFLQKVICDTGLSVKNNIIWAPLVKGDVQIQEESGKTPKPNSRLSLNHSNVQIPVAALCDKEKEPKDLLQFMEKVAECDIKYFVDFTQKKRPLEKLKDDFYPDVALLEIPIPREEPLELKILKETRNQPPELRDLIAAFTAKSANDIVNLERMETLGDSFLKFAVSLFLFREFPDENEGTLTSLKGKLVSNRNLLYCGQERCLTSILQVQDFSADCSWNPPLFEVPDKVTSYITTMRKNPRILYDLYVPYEERIAGQMSEKTWQTSKNELDDCDEVGDEADQAYAQFFLNVRSLNDKGIADCLEAVIGTFVMAGGIGVGFDMLSWFKILPKEKGSMTNLMDNPCPSATLAQRSQQDVLLQLEKAHYTLLEDSLNYKFKDKSFLLQALTHPTFPFHRVTDCYQRLEFLGDAVMDFLITCYIGQVAPWMDPGEITLSRSALVNNTTFGSLVVRHGLHRFLLASSPSLTEAINMFVTLQESRNHEVDEAVLILLEERDCRIAEAVEVPKVLGDLFESIAGAIFLDSGNSLETVWRVFYPILKNELELFTKSIPRNSIQLLHEAMPRPPNIRTTPVASGFVQVVIEIISQSNETISFHGFGRNKFEAKRSAAKLALKHYYSSNTSGVSSSSTLSRL